MKAKLNNASKELYSGVYKNTEFTVRKIDGKMVNLIRITDSNERKVGITIPVNKLIFIIEKDLITCPVEFTFFRDWFDAKNKEHLLAYQVLNLTGFWPEDFIPESVHLSNLWTLEALSKIATNYLEIVFK